MADNIAIKDGAGATVTVRSTDSAGVQTPHQIVDAVTVADGSDATQGVTTGAAVITDATGTLQQYLRGLVKMAASWGISTGAAVTTDATGTLQQYLRGIVTLLAAKIGITIADGDDATLGVTTGAAIVTDVNGTVQRYLRGLVKLWISGLAAGEAHIGAVGGNSVSVAVTPTLTVHATYVANDYVGTSTTPMTFAGMARVNGGTGTIMPSLLIDFAMQSVACELWLFDTTLTTPADSAAWTFTDSSHLVAVIPFSAYYASAVNSVSISDAKPIIYKCAVADTALYGALVTRGAPAYADGDLTVKLNALLD